MADMFFSKKRSRLQISTTTTSLETQISWMGAFRSSRNISRWPLMWMSELLKEFAPDGNKDEPNIRKNGNGFNVQFRNGQTKYTKTLKTLALAVAHRDVKAKEFGLEDHVANRRIQNRLVNGTGTDEGVRFASALEFLKIKFPETYSSMDETNISWNANPRQWRVATSVDGKLVTHGLFYMWQLADAIAKRDEVRGYTNQERDERNAAIVATNPMYKDVPYAATNDGLKTWRKKHWSTNYMDNDRPMLVVKGPKGFLPACQHAGCDSAAQGDGRGGKSTVCYHHGGGKRCLGAPGVDGGCPNDCALHDHKYDGMCVRCFCDAEPDDERAKESESDWQPPVRAPSPPPPPNEWTWMNELLKEFAPDGIKDEPFIVKAKNSFTVQFKNDQAKYQKTFKTLALAVAHRDEKAKEFGLEEDVATKRAQNRLLNGTGTDEGVRFASALEFLKLKFPETYSSMDETNIHWCAKHRRWMMQTSVDGKTVFHGRFYMWQFAEAVAKRDEVRGYTNQERDERNAAILADPMYKDVPYAATNDGLKTWNKKHWSTNRKDGDRPWLVVKGTDRFFAACQHAGCDSAAQGDGRGGKLTVCNPHGGGKRCLGAPGVDGGCPNDCAVCTDKYKGMCVRCFCVAEPDDKRAINAKTYFQAKEQAVRTFLETTFTDYKWTFDTAWDRPGAVEGHPKYRPDALTTIADRVIIAETDENSHVGYNCAKERVREATFVAIAASRDQVVVLLRLNPDG